ncbi:MAG TPA: CRTAC1 family protein, partial [Luteitalea sp.]|nr:CRTAC1 family protein [Luteitalea sp.]
VDGDDRLDIYLVNGGTLDVAAGRMGATRPAALFRNRGDGTFVDIAIDAGVTNGRWGQGVCAGDYDNDGDADLFVANIGTSRLYQATAPARFADVAPRAGVAVEGGASGCAFGDYDNDGWLDLFVSGYVSLDVTKLPPAPATAPADAKATASAPAEVPGMAAAYTGGASVCRYRGTPVMCGPRGLQGEVDHLFRNNRDGTFTETTAPAGVADTQRRYGFGVAWADLDNDGWLDLVVANDSGPNHVYRNRRDGTFADVSYTSGAGLDGSGRAQAHMGIAVGDYDNDGHLDLHITNFAGDFNVLYRNQGGFVFDDVSHPSGVATASMPFLGWGTDFIDYDNDGWRDLLVVNGHVYPQVDQMPWGSSYAQRAQLFRNLQGRRFEEIGAAAGPALTTTRAARGSAIGDYDNDGALDILIGVLDGTPALARNAGGATAGHWLSIRLIGDPAQRCPRDAIGSLVTATVGGRRISGEVASGRGQVSQSDTRVHLGLGTATSVDTLEVRWAGGTTRTYPIARVDAFVTIDQRTGAVIYAPK